MKRPPHSTIQVGLIAWLALGIILSLYRLQPLASVPANAPPVLFSAERALRHIAATSVQPHPIGSAEHARVRDYLMGEAQALGLNPQVQTTTVAEQLDGPVVAATVNNLVARIPGTQPTRAVVLMAHYDSIPTSKAANDDGAGIATLLETARALKAGPALRNDVILLWTDAEEPGLLGAQAFVDRHPWATSVGVVLNFEAGGSGGPSVISDISADNGWLISQIAAAAPRPVASSGSYEVFKYLPFGNDLSRFKQAGLPGVTFSYGADATVYHRLTDGIDHVDPATLQHHGSYALSLARHFADLDLSAHPTGDHVYFDILSMIVVHYPLGWVPVVMIGILLLWAVTLRLGLHRGWIAPKALGLGAAGTLGVTLGSALLVSLIWLAVRVLGGAALMVISSGDVYQSTWLMIGLLGLALAILGAGYSWLAQRLGAWNVAAGASLLWALVVLLTSLLAPGLSYLAAWPLGFCSLGWLWIWRTSNDTAWRQLALGLGATPAVILIPPALYLLYIVVRIGMAGLIIALLAMTLGLLIPIFEPVLRRGRPWLKLACGLLGLGCIGMGILAADFDTDHPQPDNIIYGLDSATGEAWWASFDQRPDAWTEQFLSSSPQPVAFERFLPFKVTAPLGHAAPPAPLAAPTAEVISDSRTGPERLLRLRVRSPRQATTLAVYIDAATPVVGAEINGIPTGPPPLGTRSWGWSWGMQYLAPPPEGVDLTLRIQGNGPVRLHLVDISDGLPEIAGQTYSQRPANTMPRAGNFFAIYYRDGTFVSATVTIADP